MLFFTNQNLFGFDIGVGYGFSKHKVELKYRQTSKSDPIAQQKDDFDSEYKNFEVSYNYFFFERTFERMVCWWYF